MRNLFTKLFFFVVCLLAPVTLFAQDSSSMTGTVTDLTGAIIPGTVVSLVNQGTGAKFEQTTNKQGTYRFANVPSGDGYVVTFSHDGFAALKVDKVSLAVATPRTQDAKLTAGKSETIEVVSSGVVTLNTTDATVGNNVDVQTLNQLPVQDRTSGVSNLFNLQPGVDNTSLGGSGSVTGARTDQTNVTLDGMDTNDIAAGTTFAVIGAAPIDAVQQFTGIVAGLTPGVGTGAGGQFQLVTKSGTNHFHGNINEYHRDTTTAANTYFNNLNGLPRTPLIRNQFGGNVGGPILKDKLFFFFDIADSRIVQSGTAEPTVPMTSLYTGTGQLNYINSNAGCSDTSRLNLTPTCISPLNATQVAALDPAHIGFDSSVLAFLKARYPAPNDFTRGDGVNTAGLRFTYPSPTNEITYVGRVDYSLTHTQKIFGRFSINRANYVYSGPELPGDPDSVLETDHSYGYVVSHIWTLGNNKVNQFYYGDTISKLNYPNPGFPTSPNSYSFTGLSNPYGSYNSQARRVPIPVVRDDFNWQIGNHALNFGGQFKFIKTNSNSIGDYNLVGGGLTGTYLSQGLDPTLRPANIYTNPTGATAVAINDYDSLFATSLGLIGSISTNFNYTAAGNAVPAGTGGPRAYRFFETEAYFGDTWKITRRLTLSYGVRYQLYSVPYEVHGEESLSQITGMTPHQSTFNTAFNLRLKQNASGVYGATTLPLYQEVLGGKANNGPSSYEPSYKDFAPRVAMAYSPNPHTTVNASAGIVYDRTVINAINFLQDQLSFLFYNNNSVEYGAAGVGSTPRLGANLSYSNALNPQALPIKAPYTPYLDGTGAPVGLAQEEAGFVIDPTLKDPYSIALNAGVQQEFAGHLIMKLNYVGRLGRRLAADADAAQVLDFPDKISGQGLSSAFGSVTTQLRNGANPESAKGLVAQPWFENIITPTIGNCTNYGYANCTSLAADFIGQYGNRGDIGDAIPTLFAFGILPANVGMPAQFGNQTYLTNKGSSNYHALLLTVNKNLSQGLRFDFNYTWSHSIDNTSLTSNNNALYSATGFICDATKPRACRGNSDFDVRQEINSDFTYDLPFGRGKMFAGHDSIWLDEAIGGWSLSGIPAYRTGLAITAYSDAFNASAYNQDPAIFTGNIGDLRSSVNKSNKTVYNFAGGAAGANKVLAEFRGPIGLEYGQRNLIHGPGAFNLDMGLAKIFPLIPSKNINLQFRADAFNLLNHPNFANPTLNIVTNASPFGQITGTTGTTYRVGQFSARIEF